ncbi:MAG: hypothetical protein R3293_19810 [Candidatus Promineifilaceae bacterium]|nr:hypothetical protein [Candidatus Promineifilaceae bacterium]
MYLQRVKNDSVWGSLKILYVGALLIFLINIFFGFTNSFSAGDLPRWQMLIHLHSGSIGWITLSAIGIAIWIVTGQRDVDAAFEGRVRMLVWIAALIFAAYVISFGLAYSRPSGILVALLPLFGFVSVLILWYSAIWSFAQFSKQPVVTTVHFLAAGALLTAAIGGTVGMLLGLERVIGEFLPLPGDDRVGAHAGMMDTYLFLVASCIVEWSLRKEETRWSWPGLLQALFWMVGAVLVPIAFFLNILDQILPIFGLLLLLAMIIFLVRYGWRALTTVPRGSGVKSWNFFGVIWLVLYLLGFLYVVGSGADFELLPPWFGAFFAHAGFVGMMTNLILAVVASRGQEAKNVLPWGEAASFWAINLGLIAFIALKIAVDIRHGAIIMGLGILLAVFTMLRRLQAS